MTLTLFDRTAAITMTVSPDQAITLLGQLPADIRARIRPDDQVRGTQVPSTCTTCGAELGGGVPMGCSRPEACPDCGAHPFPRPPGYFGLAVAQAYDTWGDGEAYQAYLRGEHADPRD